MALIYYRTRGIVLDKKNKGEADQMLAVFTEDFGLITVLAKSIRKINSKLRPGAEIFCFSEIEFVQGKSGKILTDAVLIEKFKKLRESPAKFILARETSDILQSALIGQEKDNDIWNLLRNLFVSVEKTNTIDGAIAIYYSFLCKLFCILGYGADFHNSSDEKTDNIFKKARNSLKLYYI